METKYFSFFTLLALWLTSYAARAQAPSVVDTTPTGTMDGFELYNGGLNWWSTGYPGDEVIRARPGLITWIAALPGTLLNRRASQTYIGVNSIFASTPMNGVVRTDSNLYFYSNNGGFRIMRRALFGTTPDDLGIDFGGVTYDQVGAMIQYGNSLVWSVVQGGQGQIHMKALDGPPGGGDAILFSNIGLAKKLAVYTTTPDPNAPSFQHLAILTFDGLVYTYIVAPSVQDPGPQLLASNVTDFAIRQETHLTGKPPFGIGFTTTMVMYTTTGVNLGSDRLSGRVVSFDLVAGGNSTVYDTGDVNFQLTGVAVDGQHLYITQTPVTPGSGIFGPGLDLVHSQILRKGSPASSAVLGIGITDFATIAINQEGRNLRADEQWLYWASGNQLLKIKNDTPALQLDLQAVGLEAVQTVQDFKNSLPLVALKGTIVRAYARVVTNTTGLNNFAPTAQLRGFLNGTELPNSPIYPDSLGLVDATGDLPTLRGSLQRSFLFQLPGSWIANPGNLELDFTVNPNGSVPETGVAPLNNNTASATLPIVAGRRPSVVFKAMSSVNPNYDMFAPNSGFSTIINRANSVLPLDHLKIYFSPDSVTKPVLTITGIKGRSFSLPSDQQEALTILDITEFLSSDPPGASDVHWAGMFPPADQPWNGLGDRPGKCLILRMDATSSWTGAWGAIMGGYTLAHELSHNYGRKHIDQTLSSSGCPGQNSAGPWDVEPGGQDPCTLGTTDLTSASAPIGYDWITGNLIPPASAADIMTYASAIWMSPYNWNALISAIPTGDTAPASDNGSASGNRRVALAGLGLAGNPLPHGPIFQFSGIIQPSLGIGWMLPAWQFPAGTLDPAKVQQSLDDAATLPADAPYRLRLLGDPNAAPLIEQPLAVRSAADGDVQSLHFVQAVPFVAGVTRIQLLAGNQVIAEINASPNAPAIQLNAPVFDSDTQSLVLSWSATDADGDPLYFTTQFSRDNGASWHTLLAHDPTLGLAVNTGLLPGGDQCLLRVIASDGLNTAIATTAPFVLPKHAPLLSVSGLRDQQQFDATTPIFIRALAYDPEDGPLDPSTIQWTLSGLDSRSATGDTLVLHGLAPGSYMITAAAADSDGNTGSSHLTFQVRPMSIPDSTTAPVLDGLCADAAYVGAAVVQLRVNTGNRPPTTVRLVHNGGYLYVAFTELDYTTTATLPASVGIYFDTLNGQDADAQITDVGFGINEQGVLSQVAGNRTAMAIQPVASGFTAAIALGDNSWSAELRIADTLLGGWNHQVGFMLAHYFPNLFNQSKTWPAGASVDHPNTWTTASFGSLPAIANRAPTAVATAPALVSLGEPQAVGLDGTDSYDLDGDALSYAWTQIDGPPVPLTGANTAKASFDTSGIATEATLHFQLVVSDSETNSTPATVGVHLIPLSSPPAPAQSVLTISNTDGSISGKLPGAGTPGGLAYIQASSNLVDWVTIETNSVAFLQDVLFTDSQAGLYPQRFYRAESVNMAPVPAGGSDLRFNGKGAFVQVAHDPALDAFPLTITFWLKTTDTNTQALGLVSKYADASLNGYALFLLGGHVRGWYFKDANDYVWDGGEGLDGGFVANGNWQHIAMVVDNASGRLYVNGALASSFNWTGMAGATTTSLPLQFGRYSTYPVSFQGELDEITLWNHAFTEDEIGLDMNHPLSGSEPGLLGYWPLDDGSGPTATDATGHGYNGTLENGPVWQASTVPLYH
jgi:hypothetical protein